MPSSDHKPVCFSTPRARSDRLLSLNWQWVLGLPSPQGIHRVLSGQKPKVWRNLVLICFPSCCDKTLTKGNLPEGRVCMAWLPRCSPSQRELRAGTSRREMKPRLRRALLLACWPQLVQLACFSQSPLPIFSLHFSRGHFPPFPGPNKPVGILSFRMTWLW